MRLTYSFVARHLLTCVNHHSAYEDPCYLCNKYAPAEHVQLDQEDENAHSSEHYEALHGDNPAAGAMNGVCHQSSHDRSIPT